MAQCLSQFLDSLCLHSILFSKKDFAPYGGQNIHGNFKSGEACFSFLIVPSKVLGLSFISLA